MHPDRPETSDDIAAIRAMLEVGIPVEKVNVRGGGVRRRTLFLRGDTLWVGRRACATKSFPLADLVLSRGLHGLGKQDRAAAGRAAARIEKDSWLYLVRVALAVGPKGQTTRGSVSTRTLQLRPHKCSSTSGPLDPRALGDMLQALCDARRSELQLRARSPLAAGDSSRAAEQPGCFRTVNGVPHKSGVLHKKSRWLGSWSRCFFLVNGTQLQLYELPEDEQGEQQQPEQQPPLQLPPSTAGACIEHEIVSVNDVPPRRLQPEFRFEVGVRPSWGLVRLEMRCSCAAEKYAWLTTLRAVVRSQADDNTSEIREQPNWRCDETVDQTIDQTIERCTSNAAPSDPRAVAMMRERAQVGSAGLAVLGLTTRHIAVKDNIPLYA